jgi:hypothetical protein
LRRIRMMAAKVMFSDCRRKDLESEDRRARNSVG